MARFPWPDSHFLERENAGTTTKVNITETNRTHTTAGLPRQLTARHFRSELIRRAPKVTREILDGSDVAAYGSLSVITTLEFFEHHFAKVGHRLSPYDPTLSLQTHR